MQRTVSEAEDMSHKVFHYLQCELNIKVQLLVFGQQQHLRGQLQLQLKVTSKRCKTQTKATTKESQTDSKESQKSTQKQNNYKVTQKDNKKT